MTDHTTLKRRAAELRNNQTPAEHALWQQLRMRNVGGVRFLRQRVIGNFIVDFYAPALRLAIELDGGQHYDPDAQRYDAHRGAWLAAQGITVLRYTNLEVSRRMDDVLRDMERTVARLELHSAGAARRPPSCGRG